MSAEAAESATAEEQVEPRDYSAEIDRLLHVLGTDPEDAGAAEQLLEVAREWMSAEGLGEPEPPGSADRVALARWLSHVCPGGKVVHFGWRDVSLASAFTPAASEVVSYVDHPARAMVATLRNGSENVRFWTLSDAASSHGQLADLVLIETQGLEPVIPLRLALSHLRAGGWLAVLGAPIVADLPEIVETGSFRADPAGAVLPCRSEPGATRLTVYRFASHRAPREAKRAAGPGQSAPSNVSPRRRKPEPSPGPRSTALVAITRDRVERSREELDLERHGSRIRKLPTPPQELIDWVGGGTPAVFESVGRLVMLNLVTYCRLAPTAKVLEPGCGCGRNAKWIAPFLDPEQGAFEGFDIYEPAIDWADREITSHYPNVRFRFADIENTTYNPGGKIKADGYRFPYADESFDLVFLPSVFTHLTDPEFRHYTREIRRVLRTGGLLLSWHFLLDDPSRRQIRDGASSIPFQPYDDVSWVRLPDNPCAAIAYDEAYVLGFYESLGLRAQRVLHGSWSGTRSEGYDDFQDIVLAFKHG